VLDENILPLRTENVRATVFTKTLADMVGCCSTRWRSAAVGRDKELARQAPVKAARPRTAWAYEPCQYCWITESVVLAFCNVSVPRRIQRVGDKRSAPCSASKERSKNHRCVAAERCCVVDGGRVSGGPGRRPLAWIDGQERAMLGVPRRASGSASRAGAPANGKRRFYCRSLRHTDGGSTATLSRDMAGMVASCNTQAASRVKGTQSLINLYYNIIL
jgi:hypothetical protein